MGLIMIFMVLWFPYPLGIQKIKELADGVDELTSRVVEKAEMVSKNPQDKRAKEELDLLRHKWANQVRELTRVIDDIIDPEDFMAQSGESSYSMTCYTSPPPPM